jgi:hypothetical protein
MRASQDPQVDGRAQRIVVYGVTGSRESIIAWHVRSFASKRRRIAAWEADPAKPAVLRLTSTRATDAWLGSLASSAMAEGTT